MRRGGALPSAALALAFALALAPAPASARASVAAETAACPAVCQCFADLAECPSAAPDPAEVPSWVCRLSLDGVRPPPDWFVRAELPRLVELSLKNNSFERPPDLGRTTRANLSRLSLARNEISTVTAEAFAAAPALAHLDLEKNRIERLGPGDLPPSALLRTLRLAKNRISRLEPGAFRGLVGLKELRLEGNRLVALPQGLFRDLRELETLDLSRNRVRELEALVFRNLSAVSALRLRRNRISSLGDGAFYGLSAATTLELDGNLIETVSKRWMYGLDALQTLSLASNRVVNVEAECWEWSGRLRELDLSGNRLRRVDAATFERLDSLRRLDLSRNEIASVAEGAFARLPSLETLELGGNRISWTVEDMSAPFAGLSRLATFSLANNSIKSIGDGAFVGLGALADLDLGGNEITSLQERAFEPLGALRRLRLDASSLLCDCALAWFAAWIARLPPAGREGVAATCAYPERLRGGRLADLDSSALSCDVSPKPKIDEQPEPLTAIKGETVRLRCAASSSSPSPMSFLWRRDDVELADAAAVSSVERSAAGGAVRATSSLEIRAVADSDAGRYQCVASNAFGATYSAKARMTVVVYPRFVKTPADATVDAGETAKLECAAEGEPAPQIAWQKDDGGDFPAARERRMHVMPADAAFFIVNSKPADAGVYSCTARNPAGSISANATLVVLEAPSFVTAMENKEATAGESVVIECTVSGSPKPSLRWLKDGAPIAATERHFFTAEDQLLVITSLTPADEGLYECEIANALGTVRDSTELRVLPPTTPPLGGDDGTTGIVIIAVVCCAVATSTVWVIIIYQTRKRMRRALPTRAPESLVLDRLDRLSFECDAGRTFADDDSDRSSCKDSGTGDSAKRSDVDAEPPGTCAVTVYANPADDEGRLLLVRAPVPEEIVPSGPRLI